MVSILSNLFLTFSCLLSGASSPVAQIEAYNPSVNIQIGTFEVEWWREGLIGRHQMLNIKSYEYLDSICIKKLTETYNGNALNNFHFKSTFSCMSETTISTTIKVTKSIAKSIGAKVGIDNLEISADATMKKSYSIENTISYSYAEEKSFEVEYDVIPELVKGKKFFLCMAAYTYKISCEQWQIDDWWWGSYEVDGSRSSFTTYYTVDPFITIGFEDGSIIK